MRSLVLLCLFVPFTLAPVSRAQDYELPPCSVEDSNAVHDTVYLPYRDLGMSYQSLSTLEGLFDYSERHLQLRDEVFPQLSLCAEHLEIGWLLAQTADDTLAAFALDRFGVPTALNPLAKPLPDYIRRTTELLIDDLISLDNGSRSTQRHAGAEPCSFADIEQLQSSLIPDFHELVDRSIDSSETLELLEIVVDVIEFRDRLWQTLPRCEEGLELGLMMRQIVSDVVSMYAMEYAGAKAEDIPYRQAIETGMDDFTARLNALIDNRGDASGPTSQDGDGIALMRVYGSRLPGCSVFQGTLLAIRLALPHKAVITRASELESIDDLLAFAQEEVDQQIWSSVPHCAEAVETSWFVRQVTGDFAAARAMELTGIPDDANPYRQPAERGAERFAEIHAYVHNEGWSDPLTNEDGALEACTAFELASMNAVASHFSESLVSPALKVETSDQLIAYGNLHVDWREGLWGRLPACLEAVKLGVLMGEMASEFTPAFALRLSGFETDGNPYMLRALSLFAAFVDETIMKVISDEKGNAETTYYVTANPYANIRSCAATSCEIVASAKRGDRITVIDDSSEWFEIELENGESAFIAGFLTSKKPPDS